MDTREPRVLAIVPARAGSKGIPRKNLARVGDNTLVGHACQVAIHSPSVRRVVITTDDDEMGREGLRNGADLFIRRPAHLASDSASSADAWRHAWVEAERELDELFELSVWLQPTSPTRTEADVEATIEAVMSTEANAGVTISPVPSHFTPYKQVTLESDGTVKPLIEGSVPNVQRQDLPTSYWLNGHCYAARRDTFLVDAVVIPEGTVGVVIDRLIANIDDPEDLEFARWLKLRERDV